MLRLAHFLGSGRRKCTIGAFGAFSMILSPGTHLLLGATFGPGAVDDSYSLELEDLGKERVPASRRMADGTDRLVGKIPAHAARACSPASPQPYQASA
jgi:hypothetical protein